MPQTLNDNTTQPSYPWLLTSLWDSSGVSRGKSIPLSKAESAARHGIGASPSWSGFCVDDSIAWTSYISPVGDHRLKPDLSAIKKIDDNLYWAPAEVWLQSGERAFWCARHLLRKQTKLFEDKEIEIQAAAEIEFMLFKNSIDQNEPWHAYGIGGLIEHEAFVNDVMSSFQQLELGIEQFHSEYGNQQYELSLTPTTPIEAIDKIALSRLLLQRTANKHGYRISFSPLPVVDGAGNGAHLHFSFLQNGTPLLSGGSENIHGITHQGASIIGGIVRYLPEMIGLLAPSILSQQRLQPNQWAGAYSCWGEENREAALRYCTARGNTSSSAHLEVKCVDPSANPYIACATVLAMALAGLEEDLPLPPETKVNPSVLSPEERDEHGIKQLLCENPFVFQRLEKSNLANRMLPAEYLEALIAVRHHEFDALSSLGEQAIVQKLRFAWAF